MEPEKENGGSPKASPKIATETTLLLEGVAAVVRRAGLRVTNHTRLIDEEVTRTGRSTLWIAVRREQNVRGGCAARGSRQRKSVAALVASLKLRVNLVVTSRAGRSCAEVGQSSRETETRTRGRKSDFRRGDRTERTNRGRFVCCHFRLNQVRDCDGRDDQNDRHDDQQFDKRKALLFVHLKQS